jgi:hypothetical protein
MRSDKGIYFKDKLCFLLLMILKWSKCFSLVLKKIILLPPIFFSKQIGVQKKCELLSSATEKKTIARYDTHKIN